MVVVKDVNDERGKFDYDTYSVIIPESMPVGSIINSNINIVG